MDYDITLREATAEDAANLLRLVTELNQETPYILVNNQALQLTAGEMAEEIEFLHHLPKQLILVAATHNRLIGVATVSTSSDNSINHIGEIGISIKKDFWGLGLGTALLTEVLDWAAQTYDLKRLEIKVQERNTRAIKLYQKLGFQTEGIIRLGVKSADNQLENVVLMSRLINQKTTT
ncbi:GNAT family N-acetyltransferase [Vagococcus vulneris]|uniref:N-acetyltransferase domain-containing protein n=1 Tax=Vagococcus vulneris TaxID=1977869 RepID=A0A430A0A7_9ENTE|nr:GNAT family protein [Vagococcus vulneris]RST99778.1 hypothetical protein CBF37_03375 [Vagococcus vulneris]